MARTKKPKVSIVIPTFNRSEFVQKAIETSLNQTYPCEVIVCDHGSTDDTPKVMKKYGNKIKYIRREEDFGPHFCWLEGIIHAQGEYVHLQFDDDWLDEKFIEECMKLMKEDVGVVIAVGEDNSYHYKKMFKKSGIFPKKALEKNILKGYMPSPGGSLFRKKELVDALYLGDLPLQKYSSYHGVGPDYFFTLLVLLRYKKIGIIVKNLAFFGFHEGSITIQGVKDPVTYKQFRNAYENVITYYMFLKWFWLFDKLKWFSFRFLYRDITRRLKITLKRIGVLDKLKNRMNNNPQKE